MINSNEVATVRIGSFLLIVAGLIAAPLAFSATLPATPSVVTFPAKTFQETNVVVPEVSSTVNVVQGPEVTISASKARKTQKKVEETRVWQCETKMVGRADSPTGVVTAVVRKSSVRVCGWE